MKSKLLFIAILGACLVACTKNDMHDVSANDTAPQTGGSGDGVTSRSLFQGLLRYAGSNYSQQIARDTANRMIESYLASVNYPGSNTGLRSLSFDADTLRSYLNDNRIVTLRFALAHTQSYMNSGHYGQNSGTNAGSLTLVIIGLDQNDNFIYSSKNMVYDNMLPCPTFCPDNYSATLQ
jgi:hypothetical protein